MIPHGLASQSGLRVGDRILEVNSIDLRHATHQEAVRALLANKQEIRMLVRRDPSPPGMQVGPLTAAGFYSCYSMQKVALRWQTAHVLLQEVVIQKQPGEKLGISIRGGAKGHAGNPFDATDEGVFISKVVKRSNTALQQETLLSLTCTLSIIKQVSSTGAAARDGRLQVGMRILEVNNHSLLGMTHTEAVRVLRAVGDSLSMLVCDGFDPQKVTSVEVRDCQQLKFVQNLFYLQ